MGFLNSRQPQQAAPAVGDDLRDMLVAIGAAIADQDDRSAQAMLREILAAPQQEVQEPDPSAAAEHAETMRRMGEKQSFEAWFKVDCPVEGVNARIAAKAAWQARAALDAPQADSQPAPSEDTWKDGDTAALVNQLRDVAVQYRDTQQLRDRIAHIVRPLAARVAHSGGALDLLDEVATCFTRDDDLPNGLLPRIDAMLTARKEGK